LVVILVGDGERIDFSEPIELSQGQFEKFKKGFLEIYDKRAVFFEPMDFEDMRSERLGEFFPSTAWDRPEELEILIMPISTEEKSRLMGRPYMSVFMQECEWLPRYLAWRKDNGRGIKDEVALIKKFLTHLELEKKKERTKRSKVVLLQCTECGTYHDPRNKEWGLCNICAERLREVKVTRKERAELYVQQPAAKKEYVTGVREMLKEYPLIKDE